MTVIAVLWYDFRMESSPGEVFDFVKPYIKPEWRKPLGLSVGILAILGYLATAITTIGHWIAVASPYLSPLFWSVLLNAILLPAVAISGWFLMRSRNTETKIQTAPEESTDHLGVVRVEHPAGAIWNIDLYGSKKTLRVKQKKLIQDFPYCAQCHGVRTIEKIYWPEGASRSVRQAYCPSCSCVIVERGISGTREAALSLGFSEFLKMNPSAIDES